ncbi:equilibrative nucleoside transporter 3-like [Oppia nitens]|uniref:equilibrative nucleoside transporter 3-like n=1 Tax=Oppia nitens TaxID=1686743 RepID=UPI0023DB877D|nr:equilibrative nucleoside transporter 3-like [Oppia nitens]
MDTYDHYNVVLFILVLHGIGTLMPWNMFINAQKYFECKLNITDPQCNRVDHLSNETLTGMNLSYKEDFLSYLGVSAQVPNVLFNLLNIIFQFGGKNLTISITVAIAVEVVLFIMTIILAMVDSSGWPAEFFYITMATVVLINIANGVYQNSVYGLAAKLPMKYSNAVVLGSNISGAFTSVINIIAIALSPNLRVAAIYYFLAALLILLACFDTYFALPLNKFFRHYCLQNEDAIAMTGEEANEETEIKTVNNRPNLSLYWFVFKKISVQCFNVFMVFFVTLSIFPAVHANIKPIDVNFFGDQPTTDKYFTAVNCFLVFNISAMIGNIFPNWFRIPSPKYLWIPVVLRVLLIPFFLFCNYHPELRQWPVIIQNDFIFILGGIVLGLSSGYYSSLCMMYAPRCVPPEHAATAGMMAAASLVIGIFGGVNFSFVLSWAVKQNWF